MSTTRLREGQTRMSVEFEFGPWGRHGRLQWYAANRIPTLIAKAAQEGGYASSAHYIRTVLLRALEHDLGIDFEEMDREQPSKAANKIYKDPTAYGASNSVEEVI